MEASIKNLVSQTGVPEIGARNLHTFLVSKTLMQVQFHETFWYQKLAPIRAVFYSVQVSGMPEKRKHDTVQQRVQVSGIWYKFLVPDS